MVWRYRYNTHIDVVSLFPGKQSSSEKGLILQEILNFNEHHIFRCVINPLTFSQ